MLDERLGLGRHHGREHRLCRGATKRRLPAQHLIGDARERVDVAPRVQRPVTSCVLGAHVPRRADEDAAVCEPIASGCADGHCDAEVGQHWLAVVQQDVFGFNVSVQDALAMRVVERAGDRAGDRDRFIDGQFVLACQTVAQGLAFDQGHDVIQEPLDRTGIVKGHDVRVLQLRRDADLSKESIGAQQRRQLRPQDLHRDLALVLQVGRGKDNRHAAFSQPTFEPVVLRETRCELLLEVRHPRPFRFLGGRSFELRAALVPLNALASIVITRLSLHAMRKCSRASAINKP